MKEGNKSEASNLREKAEKYANLYDFAPSGYFILSKEGEIIDTNQSGKK